MSGLEQLVVLSRIASELGIHSLAVASSALEPAPLVCTERVGDSLATLPTPSELLGKLGVESSGVVIRLPSEFVETSVRPELSDVPPDTDDGDEMPDVTDSSASVV